MVAMSDPEDETVDHSTTLYSIQYKLNLLPMIGAHFHMVKDPWTGKKTEVYRNADVDFMNMCSDSDEIEMFQSEYLQDLIDFKWNAFASGFHKIGMFIHITYLVAIFIYVTDEYIYRKDEALEFDNLRLVLSIVILCTVVYPLVYESLQMCRFGMEYF